jgi:hypothetical protein
MKIVEASAWVGRFLTIVICGALFACTSTGNGPAIDDDDAGVDKTPTATPEAGGNAGRDERGGGADPACVPSQESVATVDAGALFGCYQTACASELSGCAADCVCNAAVTTGLECLLADAGTGHSCFYPPILRNASNVAVRSAGTCLERVLMEGECERSAGGQAEDGSGGESGAPGGG